MASENVVMLSDASFDEQVLKSDLPVLVDFYADWCAPCRIMAPVIEEVADAYAGKVKICKLDTDAHRNAPTKFGISGIPTMILFKGGEVSKRFVGVTGKADLTKALDDAG